MRTEKVELYCFFWADYSNNKQQTTNNKQQTTDSSQATSYFDRV